MSRIDVVPEGKKFKILVNFVQYGILHSSPLLANKIAKKIQENELPRAAVKLAKVD